MLLTYSAYWHCSKLIMSIVLPLDHNCEMDSGKEGEIQTAKRNTRYFEDSNYRVRNKEHIMREKMVSIVL